MKNLKGFTLIELMIVIIIIAILATLGARIVKKNTTTNNNKTQIEITIQKQPKDNRFQGNY